MRAPEAQAKILECCAGEQYFQPSEMSVRIVNLFARLGRGCNNIHYSRADQNVSSPEHFYTCMLLSITVIDSDSPPVF